MVSEVVDGPERIGVARLRQKVQDASANDSLGPALGTAFAISQKTGLTAFHCVGSTRSRQLEHEWVVLDFGDLQIDAKVTEYDAEIDVAILQFEPELSPHLRPVPIIVPPERDQRFWSPSFPDALADTGDSVDLSGTVAKSVAKLGESPAIQLSCQQAQAGAPLNLHGASGAPTLARVDEFADGGAFGIIRWNPESDDHPGIAVGGIIFASPLSAVLSKWPNLRAEAAVLTPDAMKFCVIYCEEDLPWAEWLKYELEERFGFSIKARYNYLRYGDNIADKTRDAMRAHKNCLVIVSRNSANSKCSEHKFELEVLRELFSTLSRVIPVATTEDAEMSDELVKLAPIKLYAADSDADAALALLSRLSPNATSKIARPVFPGAADPIARRRQPEPQIPTQDAGSAYQEDLVSGQVDGGEHE